MHFFRFYCAVTHFLSKKILIVKNQKTFFVFQVFQLYLCVLIILINYKMDVKERIITEATRLFYESGIKAVRMDDIAAACGISKRTLYENFSDREELIRQSLGYYASEYEKRIRGKLESAENIMEEFWIIFGEGLEFRESNMRVLHDLVKFHPQIFEDFMKYHHFTVERENRIRFERGIAEGHILKNIDTSFLASNLTSYLYGMKKGFEDFDFLRNINNKRSHESLQFAIMLFLRGVATEKGRKYIDDKILCIDNDNMEE